MKLSEENNFWLIFIGIFILEGIISFIIFSFLKKDREKFDIVHSYIDKLTIKNSKKQNVPYNGHYTRWPL